jgi:acylphosphatase
MNRLTAYVSGNVQKVGYRKRIIDIARAFGLKGMIENLDDGRVKIIAEGDDEKLKWFEHAIEIKNTLIQVSQIEKTYSSSGGDFAKFGKLVDEGETDSRLDKGIEVMNSMLVAINQVNTTLVSMDSNLGGKIDNLSCKMDEVNENLGGKIDRLDGNLGGKIDNLSCKMDEVNENLGGKIDRLDGNLGGKIDNLSCKMDEVNENLGGKIDNLSCKMDEVNENLGGKIDSLGGKMDKVNENLGSKIDRLDGNLGGKLNRMLQNQDDFLLEVKEIGLNGDELLVELRILTERSIKSETMKSLK